jgi:glycosyltransferase involved in cell wall biosynthesis
VGVVVPVYNCEQFVSEAIESVLAQSFSDFELIVIDDGSVDRSADIAAEFASKDSRVRLLRNGRNVGLGNALNRGWRDTQALYVARLDADDVALPDRLSRQVSFLDAHPAVAVVGGAMIRIDESGVRGATMTFPTSDRGIRSTLARRSCIPHPGALIRREALERAGGYRLNEAQDFDLWLRLSERWELANLAEPVGLYREHPAQVTFAAFERRAAATLAAEASARARRAGGCDPLAFDPTLNREPLALVEVNADEVADRATRYCLELAASYELLDYDNETAALVDHARRTLGHRTDRTFAAAVALKRADAYLAARRPDAALVSVGTALRRAPRYSAGRLLSRLRDRINGRRFR